MTLLHKFESVPIPLNCQIATANNIITITGTKYTRTLNLSHLNLTFLVTPTEITINLWNGNSKEQSKVKTCASIIKNAINGCMHGYRYIVKAASIHFPMSIDIEEDGKLILVKNFLGEKAVRRFFISNDVCARHGDAKDVVVFEGKSIEDVSQCVGTLINGCRERKRDNRVLLDGFYILKKGLMIDN